MARVKVNQNVQAASGQALQNASMLVYLRGTTTQTQIYADGSSGLTIAQPLMSDDDGLVQGWVNEGSYDLAVTYNGQSQTIPWEATSGRSSAATLNVKAGYGAKGDGVTDDTVAIQNAINDAAAGLGTVFLPPGTYKTTAQLSITGTRMGFTCAPGAIIDYTGTVGGAVLLSGQYNKITLYEITAPLAPYNVVFHDLSFSTVDFHHAGACTTACIFHDGTAQTGNEGNNIWNIGLISAGSVPYGIRLDSSVAAHTYEGDMWRVGTIFSATTVSLQVGTAGTNLVRYHSFWVGVDSSAITPLYVKANNDGSFYQVVNSDAATGSAEVKTAAGTKDNWFISPPSTVGVFRVQDLGNNFSMLPGATNTGQMIMNKQLLIGSPAGTGTTPLQVGEAVDAGDEQGSFENTSITNVATKFSGIRLVNRDTLNTVKTMAAMRANPETGDSVDCVLILWTRNTDALVQTLTLGGFGSPAGVISAPPGSLYMRRDGGTGTTLYVKETGTGTAGWVAK